MPAFKMNKDSVVLIVGDSHLMSPFGSDLQKLILSIGVKRVELVGALGFTPQHWVKGGAATSSILNAAVRKNVEVPSIGHLLKDIQPNVVIASLGTNGAAGVEPFCKAVADAGAKFFWVGPPPMRKGPPVAALKKQFEAAAKGKAEWIESLEGQQYPATGGDGIHYTTFLPICKTWASSVLKDIQS